VCSSYSYHRNVLLHRFITKQVAISPLCTVCLVCSVVQLTLTEVIIVTPISKWLALTRAGWCVVCVWSTIRQAASDRLFKVITLCTCFPCSRHWSIASSTSLCCQSLHVSTSCWRNSVASRIDTFYTRSCINLVPPCLPPQRKCFTTHALDDTESSTHLLVLCVAVAYGRGVYFAKSFNYSSQDIYSPPDKNKNKHIFQCRVLTGHYCNGKPHLLEPPVKDKKTLTLYDSVVDNAKNPSIFVVFHDTQVYPEYLIVFQMA